MNDEIVKTVEAVKAPATPPPVVLLDGNPPPAAATVANATITEETLKLRSDLEALARTVKDRDLKLAELEDENHRLKVPTPIPVKRKKPDEKVIAFPWMRLGSHSGGE
jgi:hypothetical protein